MNKNFKLTFYKDKLPCCYLPTKNAAKSGRKIWKLQNKMHRTLE